MFAQPPPAYNFAIGAIVVGDQVPDHDHDEHDAETSRLIASLLEHDLMDAQQWDEVNQMQLQFALADSDPTLPGQDGGGEEGGSGAEMREDDAVMSLRLALDAVNSTLSDQMTSVLNEQDQETEKVLKQLNEMSESELLDHTLATKLQQLDEDGYDMDAVARNPRAVEALLAEAAIKLKASGSVKSEAPAPAAAATAPKDKGKGKGKGKGKEKAVDEAPVLQTGILSYSQMPTDSVAVCGICLDPCQLAFDPYRLSIMSTTSNKVPYGIDLHRNEPGAGAHTFCVSCFTTYLNGRLQDGTIHVAFPIYCPGFECKKAITAEAASRIIGEAGMETWHYRQLLDSTPTLFCPNRKCSARILNEGGVTQSTCPECKALLCATCKVLWHTDMTCAEFDKLPANEKDPEDWALLKMAEANKWQRCPSCSVVVSLSHGCNHITCICGTHFCIACGKGFNVATQRCASVPPCELWDEERLIAAQQIRHNPAQPDPHGAPAPIRERVEFVGGGGIVLLEPVNPQRARIAQARAEQVEAERERQVMEHNLQDQYRRRLQSQRDRERNRLRKIEADEERACVLAQERREAVQRQAVYEENRRIRKVEAEKLKVDMSKLSWLDSEHHYGYFNKFTEGFIHNKICGYCQTGPFPNYRALVQHLANTNQHNVYSCCGKLFAQEGAMHQHFHTRLGVHDPLIKE